MDPQDDLISGLVHAEIDEDGETRTLTLEEIVGFVQLISSAGTETVARLLGFAAVTLAKYPDQRQLLIDDPSLVPNAIEELLRDQAPSPIQSPGFRAMSSFMAPSSRGARGSHSSTVPATVPGGTSRIPTASTCGG